MALQYLTDRQIKQAKPRDKEYLLADGAGLFLRVRSSGAKDWLYIYTFAGKRRKLGLGSLETVSLATARAEAAKARDSVAQIIDPQLDRQQREAAQAAERERLNSRATVQELFEQWASAELIRRKDGGKEMRRMFEKDVLPAFGKLAVEDVKKGHIAALTSSILSRGTPRMAKLIFSSVRQMFRYAQDCDIVDVDPTAAIRKKNIGGKDTERDRVLSEAEIKELKAKLPQAGLIPTTQAAVWVCLATCCRIGELLQAKWADVDLDKQEWRIPEENSKNGKAHVVYLSDFAANQFRALLPYTGDGVWCYPSNRKTENGERIEAPVCSKTITKQIGDRQRTDTPMSKRSTGTDKLKLPGGKWTPHDLRRTGATLMTKLKVLPEVAERCLNHVEENKVKRTYQRHSYESEMRQAWKLLGERLELLLSDSAENVVTLAERAA